MAFAIEGLVQQGNRTSSTRKEDTNGSYDIRQFRNASAKLSKGLWIAMWSKQSYLYVPNRNKVVLSI